MASNSSGPLSPGESYTLGQYTFAISSQYDEGTDTTYITADCSYGEDAGVKQTTVDGEAELVSWHVECSDDAADVYATIRKIKRGGAMTSDLDTSPIEKPIQQTGDIECWTAVSNKPNYPSSIKHFTGPAFAYGYFNNPAYQCTIATATEPGGLVSWTERFNYITGEQDTTLYNYANSEFTYNDKTVYFSGSTGGTTYGDGSSGIDVIIPGNYSLEHAGQIAWTLVYGEEAIDPEYEEDTVLVARFAINPEDADVEDWDDPIDDGDPAHTLKVTIRGALSGRHNDPIYDTSYSYIPADNPTVKDYGCGGDGGYGGGGGAGASTVIVYNYSTSKAGSHETYTYARRHGYGSGGGKGGRGGDGCIIIYW